MALSITRWFSTRSVLAPGCSGGPAGRRTGPDRVGGPDPGGERGGAGRRRHAAGRGLPGAASPGCPASLPPPLRRPGPPAYVAIIIMTGRRPGGAGRTRAGGGRDRGRRGAGPVLRRLSYGGYPAGTATATGTQPTGMATRPMGTRACTVIGVRPCTAMAGRAGMAAGRAGAMRAARIGAERAYAGGGWGGRRWAAAAMGRRGDSADAAAGGLTPHCCGSWAGLEEAWIQVSSTIPARTSVPLSGLKFRGTRPSTTV